MACIRRMARMHSIIPTEIEASALPCGPGGSNASPCEAAGCERCMVAAADCWLTCVNRSTASHFSFDARATTMRDRLTARACNKADTRPTWFQTINTMQTSCPEIKDMELWLDTCSSSANPEVQIQPAATRSAPSATPEVRVQPATTPLRSKPLYEQYSRGVSMARTSDVN